MIFFIWIIVIFNNFLIAAHFLRRGDYLISFLIIMFLFVLFFRSRFVYIVLHIFFSLSTILWSYTAFDIVKLRLSLGLPYVRFGVIMMFIIISTILGQLILWFNRGLCYDVCIDVKLSKK